MRAIIVRCFILMGLLCPTLVLAVTPIVSAGGNHTVALKSDGTVWAWGWNNSGQLGDGTTTDRLSPVAVPGLTGFIAVSAGANHTAALKSDGTVWAWGDNTWGQLGDGTTTGRVSPAAVPGLAGIVEVSAGADHTIALKSDGTVWAWGANTEGVLGDGTTTDRPRPVAVPGLTGIVAISSDYYHVLALKSDGTVWVWGVNIQHQLGLGITNPSSRGPNGVPGFPGIIAVGTGLYNSVALKADGSVWAWGTNDVGQVGDGTTSTRYSPVVILGITGIVAVTAGQTHALALKSDRTILAWGSNSYGQLGDGTTTDRISPVTVPGITGIVGVTAGGGFSDFIWPEHTVALEDDGTVWAWGYNNHGQLGDGSTTDRYSPVAVLGLNLGATTSVPDAPTAVTASVGNGQAIVSFVAPIYTGNSAITGYTVMTNPAGGFDTQAGTTALPHTITGLTNGVAYSFTVRATNALGTGASSAVSPSVVPKASQSLGSVSFSPSTLTFGGTVMASATATSGLAVSFSTTTNVCTVSGSIVKGVSAGGCVIAANQAGNMNYSAAPQVTQSINVGQVAQSISFGAAPSITVGGLGTVTATGGVSGVAVTFTSTTTSVCMVVGQHSYGLKCRELRDCGQSGG
jgi:alpha-tubulin suppressor-like RCC1 family protein